ncbi:MAG TPA: phospho-N-acetylmuramoyl-pentapeptide-transferase [Spirochaetia bacterium]|nr:phospho-N-acetylmuramoyl-pentapeptide-transferase [Spirochaetia bacterium]
MLKFLFALRGHLSFFNIFQYLTFRAAYAAITALLISFLFGPWVIARLRAITTSWSAREDTPQTHKAKAGTPTMGGVLIILSFVISVLLWQDLSSVYAWLLLLGALGFGAIGFFDDLLKMSGRKRGISASVKFGGQFVISAVIVIVLYLQRGENTTLLYVPFLKRAVLDLSWFYIPFAVILMVGYSNAVNLTDGLDGLATGLIIMVCLALAILAYVTGRPDFAAYLQIPYVKGTGELAVFCLAVTGASVGFLWFNCHPADVWMGDTGALSLGGVMGIVALVLKKEILVLVLGGVFVLETASVAIQVVAFKLTGKRVFKMAPLHHHFELSGWPESKVVTRLWILGGLFAILGISTLKIQ